MQIAALVKGILTNSSMRRRLKKPLDATANWQSLLQRQNQAFGQLPKAGTVATTASRKPASPETDTLPGALIVASSKSTTKAKSVRKTASTRLRTSKLPIAKSMLAANASVPGSPTPLVPTNGSLRCRDKSCPKAKRPSLHWQNEKGCKYYTKYPDVRSATAIEALERTEEFIEKAHLYDPRYGSWA